MIKFQEVKGFVLPIIGIPELPIGRPAPIIEPISPIIVMSLPAPIGRPEM